MFFILRLKILKPLLKPIKLIVFSYLLLYLQLSVASEEALLSSFKIKHVGKFTNIAQELFRGSALSQASPLEQKLSETSDQILLDNPEKAIIYVNLNQTFKPSDKTAIVRSGNFFIIDGSELTPEERSEAMMKFMGVSFYDPVVVVSMLNNQLDDDNGLDGPAFRIYTLSSHSYILAQITNNMGQSPSVDLSLEEQGSNIEGEGKYVNDLRDLIYSAYDEHKNYKKTLFSSRKMAIPDANNPYASEINYFPGAQFELILRKEKIQCFMDDGSFENNKIDYCNKNASIDIRFSVALIRSVQSHFIDGSSSKNAKYVRVSISQDIGSGAGIHLADSITENNVWYGDLSNREVSVGPFAENYAIWVRPIKGVKPYIYSKKPNNLNTNFHKLEKSIFSIGIGPNLELSTSSNLGVGLEFGITHTRVLDWNTNEYRVSNKSSGSDFFVSWDRALNQCEELLYNDGGCYFTSAMTSSYPIFGIEKFTPTSYANFTPNIDVIYEVPADQRGGTEFEVGASVTTKVNFGSVKSVAILNRYKPIGASTATESISKSFLVNWEHSVFDPAVPALLRSMNSDNGCLAHDNDKVIVSMCSKKPSTIWVSDHLERYHLKNSDNQCLTVLSEDNIRLEACDDSLKQKWYWLNGKLYSRYWDGTGSKYALAISSNDNKRVVIIDDRDDADISYKKLNSWRSEFPSML